MSKGLTVYSRYQQKRMSGPDQGELEYVIAEYDTDKDDEKQLAVSKDITELLKQVPVLEREGGYDAGVVIDLSSPVE